MLSRETVSKSQDNQGKARLEFFRFFGTILAVEVGILAYSVNKYGFAAMSNRGDGPQYMDYASNLLSGNYSYPHFPMYPVFLRIASSILPLSVAAVVVSVTAYLLLIIVFWRTSAKLTVPARNLLSFFISWFPPTLLIYSILPYADSTALLFSALTYYFIITRREKSMLLCSVLAVVTHYLAILIFPGVVYYFLRKNAREAPKALITVAPVILFSVYQYLVRGDLFYYVHVNTTFWSESGGLLSFPFSTILYVIGNFGFFSLLLLVSTYAIYIIGLFLSIKYREIQSAVFAAPYVVFVVFLGPGAFFFVPRFVEYAFPLLFNYGKLCGNRFVVALLFLITVTSVTYAIFRVTSLP